MNNTYAPMDDAFERLQRLLVAMRTGDEVAAREASRLTGLAETTCRAMLEGLAKAGLMVPKAEDRFVRVSTV